MLYREEKARPAYPKSRVRQDKTVYDTSIMDSTPFPGLERATLCGSELCGESKCAAGSFVATITENTKLNKNKVKNFGI